MASAVAAASGAMEPAGRVRGVGVESEGARAVAAPVDQAPLVEQAALEVDQRTPASIRLLHRRPMLDPATRGLRPRTRVLVAAVAAAGRLGLADPAAQPALVAEAALPVRVWRTVVPASMVARLMAVRLMRRLTEAGMLLRRIPAAPMHPAWTPGRRATRALMAGRVPSKRPP